MVCVCVGIYTYSCNLCYLYHSILYTIVMYNMCKQIKYTVLLSELPSYSSFQVLLSHSPIRHLFAIWSLLSTPHPHTWFSSHLHVFAMSCSPDVFLSALLQPFCYAECLRFASTLLGMEILPFCGF